MPAGPPIFVTGTHRSGTTWAATMLAAPGVWYMDEPFNPNKGMWREPFSYAAHGSEAPAVDDMIRRILRGGHRRALNLPNAQHPWMPLRWFPIPPRRVLLKDPLACLLTGYLTRRFHLQTLVIFRHPCGFVASVMRLGWPTAGVLRLFLERPALLDQHLAPYADLMRRNIAGDTVESAAVLHGVLNRVLWTQTQQLGLRWCRFEDLCRDPLKSFADLFDWCGLPYGEGTRGLHEALCFADAPPAGHHPHAVQRNSRAMADGWRQELTHDEVQLTRDIWLQFDIALYRSQTDWPANDPGGAPIFS